MDELRYDVERDWWSVPDITSNRVRFYPGRLPEVLPRFLAGQTIDEPFERWN